MRFTGSFRNLCSIGATTQLRLSPVGRLESIFFCDTRLCNRILRTSSMGGAALGAAFAGSLSILFGASRSLVTTFRMPTMSCQKATSTISTM